MENKYQEYLKLLEKYVSFKSVSTDSAFKKDIAFTVEWLKKYIEEAGGKVKILQKGNTNPVVFGSFIVDKNLGTVLVYGHYDVQPAETKDGWTTGDPYKLEIKVLKEKKDKLERLVGRGVVDNKGQNLIHLFTVAELFKRGQLGFNVKFLLEGNEETGNDDLPKILKENNKDFTCDYVLVSDGEIVKDFPVCEASLRGGGNIEVEYTTGKNNLHSGIFGGAVPSASLEMSKLLSTLKGENNFVKIKDFYKNVGTPSNKILNNNKNLGSSKYAQTTAGVKSLLLQKKYDFFTCTGNLPTLEISGIKSGYIGEGFANIVPAKAMARINIRTVGKQKTKQVLDAVLKHVRKFTPKYVDLKIFAESHGDPIVLDNESLVSQDVKKVLEKAYGKKVLSKYVGGSIPILGDFQKILGAKVLSVSLGNDDCNMHGVDENFRVDLLQKALTFANMFWSKK